jgi:DNA-binding NarL/FixJ family response regulator
MTGLHEQRGSFLTFLARDNMLLTERQRQILCLCTLTRQQIAQRLGISPHTVKNHFTCIYARLGIVGNKKKEKSIMALVKAIELGEIKMGDIHVPPRVDRSWEGG